MTDFSQYDDPRVRAVFSAATRLVEAIFGEEFEIEEELERAQVLKGALSAAQHSESKEDDVSDKTVAETLRDDKWRTT